MSVGGLYVSQLFVGRVPPATDCNVAGVLQLYQREYLSTISGYTAGNVVKPSVTLLLKVSRPVKCLSSRFLICTWMITLPKLIALNYVNEWPCGLNYFSWLSKGTAANDESPALTTDGSLSGCHGRLGWRSREGIGGYVTGVCVFFNDKSSEKGGKRGEGQSLLVSGNRKKDWIVPRLQGVS